jgi:hypothetical protein
MTQHGIIIQHEATLQELAIAREELEQAEAALEEATKLALQTEHARIDAVQRAVLARSKLAGLVREERDLSTRRAAG